jgi:hypothetical protein
LSVTYISAELRRLVVGRANRRCEYCLIHEDDTALGCEVDHIVSEKHGGATDAENLAYSCFLCNRNKGSDLGSLALRTGELVRFFNPRTDLSTEHFRLDGDMIVPLTDIGEVTARVFGFNTVERQMERHALQEVGRYPV